MSPAIRHYLARNGFDIEIERKEITSLITKTDIHLKIYLLTEDYQTVDKRKIEADCGTRGLIALNDMLEAKVISSVDENIFTMGQVRSNYSTEYFERVMSMMATMMPWEDLKEDTGRKGVNLSLGDLVVAEGLEDKVNTACETFLKVLKEVHAESLKAPEAKRQNFSYALAVFELISKRKEIL